MLFLFFLFQLAFATDMSGAWVTDDGTNILIPFMRDGDIPLILKKDKNEAALWGRWSLENETLTIDLPTGGQWVLMRGYREGHLIIQKGEKIIGVQRIFQYPKAPYQGIWTVPAKGEFVAIPYGKTVYVLHQTTQQTTKLYKGKWVNERSQDAFIFKPKKKCTVSFSANNPQQADVECGHFLDTWEKYYEPVPIAQINLTGTWKFDDMLVHIQLDRFQWKEANIEYPGYTNVYKGKWAAGSMGTKFYFESSKLPSVVGQYSASSPDHLLLRIKGKDYLFTRVNE